MAMVLCNDPDVTAFCSMVQGLHQEGVVSYFSNISKSGLVRLICDQAFHLPNPRKLPLMFLPAKFDSSDGLQRLGLAYMTKSGGSAIPQLPNTNTTTTRVPETSATATGSKEPAKKRKRRQSAPAQAAFNDTASRAASNGTTDAPGVGNGGRSKKRISLGLAKVEEDSEKA
jgi:hypothetical protein